ncbi:hypothetical protein CHELA20_53928 [Hyphomicrobiales bacterium]|nr:hypothetical protein CHELA41_20999 [Hyphomicrobiales bacterium]CAH1685230.1 hypothetical protein CHELA20_53928 [Hyphomicrobiales bacterium]
MAKTGPGTTYVNKAHNMSTRQKHSGPDIHLFTNVILIRMPHMFSLGNEKSFSPPRQSKKAQRLTARSCQNAPSRPRDQTSKSA